MGHPETTSSYLPSSHILGWFSCNTAALDEALPKCLFSGSVHTEQGYNGCTTYHTCTANYILITIHTLNTIHTVYTMDILNTIHTLCTIHCINSIIKNTERDSLRDFYSPWLWIVTSPFCCTSSGGWRAADCVG